MSGFFSNLFGGGTSRNTWRSRNLNAGRTAGSGLDGAVADATGLDRATVKLVRNALFAEIANKVDAGIRVNIRGFGTFFARRVPAHTRQLPDETVVSIPERDVPKFKASGAFRDWMDEPGAQATRFGG